MTTTAKALAELVGTALLVCAIVGSGFMAQALTADVGLQLLLNMVSTVLALGVAIAVLMPLSGAHLNPAVTLAFALRREISWTDAGAYGLAQMLGGVAGTVLAHLMFHNPLLAISVTERLSAGTLVGEVIATMGLVLVILALVHHERAQLIPLVVPAWIGSAYIFTSSTSFANPAVTVGRIFTDSFAGIEPISAGGFMGAQVVGSVVAVLISSAILRTKKETP